MMQSKVSKRGFIAGLLSTVGLAAHGEGLQRSLRPRLRSAVVPQRLMGELAQLVDAAKLSGDVCCAVADMASGDILDGYRAHMLLPPASVAKAVTALYALTHLGPGFRFSTRVVATGPIQNGVLNGDLILVGNGDPGLDTDQLAALVKEVRNTGLRFVQGRFLVDASALPLAAEIDPSQPAHVAYNPGVSGLNLNHNRVYFGWTRTAQGFEIDMEARALRYRPASQMARMQVKDRGAPVYTYRDGGLWDEWTVARSALSKEGARWLPVRKPHRYISEVFQTLAQAEGLNLPPAEFSDTPAKGITLVSQQSPPLKDILKGMLKYSTNLTAEIVGMTATAVRFGKAVPLAASAAQMSRWAKERYGARNLQLVDHSGLSDRSQISASDMVAILVKAGEDGTLQSLLKNIKMRNSRGNLMREAPTTFQAKTGTLNFVAGLGGYVKTADGRALAFAIFSADSDRRAKIPMAYRENPKGASAWNRRAKILQYKVLNHWCRHFRL